MKALAGVCNNGILAVQQLLSEYGRERKIKFKVQTLGLSDEVKKKSDFILISTTHLLVKHAHALRKSNAVVIVFDTPMILEYLRPITLLDVQDKKLSYLYTFKPLEYASFAATMDAMRAQEGHVKLVREKFDVIPTMLGAQLSTILNPIQDYLYGVRDTDKRLHYQKYIYTWLVSGADTKTLQKGLMKLIGGDKVPVAMARMIEVLGQENFTKMRNAFKEAFEAKVTTDGKKKKAVNANALSKKYGVDPFDIRYTLKALRKHGTFQVVNRDVKEIYKEHVANSKARRAAQEEAEV